MRIRLAACGAVVLATLACFAQTPELAEEPLAAQPVTFFIAEEDDTFWRALAAVDDDKPAYVVRLDSKGVVCARHVGPATEQAITRVLEAPCDDPGVAP